MQHTFDDQDADCGNEDDGGDDDYNDDYDDVSKIIVMIATVILTNK